MLKLDDNLEKQLMYVHELVMKMQEENNRMGIKLKEQLEEMMDRRLSTTPDAVNSATAMREAVKLRQLLVEKGVITQEEFEAKLKE